MKTDDELWEDFWHEAFWQAFVEAVDKRDQALNELAKGNGNLENNEDFLLEVEEGKAKREDKAP